MDKFQEIKGKIKKHLQKLIDNDKNKIIQRGLPIIISSVIASTLTVGIRQLGWLQSFSLNIYDRMLQIRPESSLDERILTVLITEDDIQEEGKWPISDATLAKALTILNKAQPHAIGIDLYRDLPVEPGNKQLSTIFENNNHIITVCKLESEEFPSVAPPKSTSLDQVGFADIIIDNDGVVRRNLFFVDAQENQCQTPISLSLQLSLAYLSAEGIQPTFTESGLLQLGKTILKPIDKNTGSYHNIDANGYQLMLNYRAGTYPSPTVTLGEVLKGKVNQDLIKNKVVLLGVSAPSLKDTFYTPYSNQYQNIEIMPGVVVHANMVSQLLSTALDGQPLIWSWNETQEIGWIFLWGFLGSATIFLLTRPVIMFSLQIGGIVVIIGISGIVFLQAGWIPVVAPLFSFIGGGIGVIAFDAYKSKQEQLNVKQQVQEQEMAIAVLKMLLAESEQKSQLSTLGTHINYTKGSVIVNRYEIVKGLGKGSFGSTYLSKDLQRPGNPYCVVKRLTPSSKKPKYLKIVQRLFKTEAKILEKVGTHSQIPQLLAYIEENNEFYLIQEYVKGSTINKEIHSKGKYSEKEVLSIIEQLISILTFIQQYNLIHRDIKPDNIIRRASDNQLVLIDFGAVKEIRGQNRNKEQNKTVIIGNQGYAAPEQLAGQPVMASDIYATGIVAIHCLTGIQASKFEKNSTTGDVIWESLTHVSKPTAKIINKMVSYHFGDRYQNAEEVLNDLRRLKRSHTKRKQR